MNYSPLLSAITVGAISSLLSACGGSDDNGSATTVVDNSGSQYAAMEAISSPAYLDLASGAVVSNDNEWHFSYQKNVGFSVNGGISGNGGITACIAHTPDGLFDDENRAVQSAFEALTRDNTLAAFNAVNKTSCDESELISDGLQTRIEFSDWASYNPSTHGITLNETDSNGWIVRSATADANGNSNYGRVKVSDLTYTSGTSYTLKFSVEQWDDNAQVFVASDESAAIDFTDARQYWDMETNAIVTADADWELSIERTSPAWSIQLNSAVSGSGNAGIGHVLLDSGSAFDVTNPKTSGDDIYKFDKDSAKTALAGPAKYGAFQYGVGGGHKMWPTFTTYLFKDGERYFKAQIVSNYGEDGTMGSGNLYVRYAEVIE